jgi:hypothetical protein
MKSILKKTGATILGLSFLLVSTNPLAAAEGIGNDNNKDSIAIEGISENEIQSLLEFYQVETPTLASLKTVKVFDANDVLVYSEDVSNSRFDTDVRLKAMLNQSDYLTEVNDVKYYKLK